MVIVLAVLGCNVFSSLQETFFCSAAVFAVYFYWTMVFLFVLVYIYSISSIFCMIIYFFTLLEQAFVIHNKQLLLSSSEIGCVCVCFQRVTRVIWWVDHGVVESPCSCLTAAVWSDIHIDSQFLLVGCMKYEAPLFCCSFTGAIFLFTRGLRMHKLIRSSSVLERCRMCASVVL